MEKVTFEAAGLSGWVQERLGALGYEYTTPVQASAIPVLLEGKDAAVQSQTGSGKTIAYLAPLCARLESSVADAQVVVLVPTRELGMQIQRVAQELLEGSGMTAQAMIGGAAIGRQLEKLREHPQLIIGTPGRVLELIKLRKLKMHRVKTIVVDEVDQVLALGAAGEVEEIVKSTMRDRQLVFVSATVTPEIRDIADRWMNDPVMLEASGFGREAKPVEHVYIVCQERDKIDMVRRLARSPDTVSAIVFVGATDSIGEVAAKLDFHGLKVEALYADADKQTRASVLSRFRSGAAQLLVATDIAARGLDVEFITHVIHFDPAIDAEHYVHRSGRTGRMGRGGIVVSLLTERQLFIIRKFARALSLPIEERSVYQGKLVPPQQAAAKKKVPVRTGSNGVTAAGNLPAQSIRSGRPASEYAAGRTQRQQSDARRPAQPPAAVNGKATDAGKPVQRRTTETGKPRAARTAEGTKAPPVSKAQAHAGNAKTDRKRDQKNKGAPKWLKAKQQEQP